MNRRRRHVREEEELAEQEAYDTQVMAEPEPVLVEEPTPPVAEPVVEEPVSPTPVIHAEQPRIIAPAGSAFSWGNVAATNSAVETPSAAKADADSDDDRMPGESWVDRAYRGPTANNPSVSLKNRLKRAAFFDKRERDVAAGIAEPVDMDAGLPDAMVEEREREMA